MRPIDADTVKAIVDIVLKRAKSVPNKIRFMAFKNLIDEAPTLDVSVISHADIDERFNHKDTLYLRCGGCKMWHKQIVGDVEYTFCPHCGAKIRSDK